MGDPPDGPVRTRWLRYLQILQGHRIREVLGKELLVVRPAGFEIRIPGLALQCAHHQLAQGLD